MSRTLPGPGVAHAVEPELVLTPGGWRRGAHVHVGEDGRIEGVGAADPRAAEDRPVRPVVRLPRRALLPGFVNAHSHAFQRGLRGRGETFPDGAGSFWSWREAMYALVESLDEDGVRRWSRRAFAEMRAAGITSVGEFHYVHHDASEQGWAFDRIVLEAAREVGIRIVLLNAVYRTGGIGRGLEGGQRRFRTRSLAEYWEQMDALRGALEPSRQSLGAVAHSIRAVPIEEAAALHAEAGRRGLVFHMHLEEQPAEIEAARAHWGRSPMALVNEHLAVDGRTTMVHCTHTDPAEMERYLGAGGTVCVCPLTEANLGDGLADLPAILAAGGRVALGTDSNARIGMLEEMRLLEYGQRLVSGTRGVLRESGGEVAPLLWRCATVHGARSLGIEAGEIRAGLHADFAVVDLDHPALEGVDDEVLLAALVFGAPDGVVRGTCVGGDWSGFAG